MTPKDTRHELDKVWYKIYLFFIFYIHKLDLEMPFWKSSQFSSGLRRERLSRWFVFADSDSDIGLQIAYP